MKKYLRLLSLIVAAVTLALSLTACGEVEQADTGISKAVELYGTDYEYTLEELPEMKKAMFSFMPQAPSLYEAFQDYFYVGGCINPGNYESGKGEDFTSMMRQFNTFVLENASKPEPMHPSEDKYNFDTVDQFVEFGEEYGVRLRGHTLLWHAQCPEWFFYESGTSGDFASPEKVLKRIDEHVTTIVKRYKGKIDVWDVVNEVFNDDGTLRNSKWLQTVGDYDGDGDSYDYIEQAFISAAKADPDVRLIINDYNLEWSYAKTQGVFDIVKSMLEDGIKVDGVGLQMHIGYDTNIETLRKNLEILAGLREYNPDFKIEVTEMDMSCFKWGDDSKTVELTDSFMAQYNKTYVDAFKLFMEYAEMGILDSVTFWGINDDHTWLNSDGRINHPFLIGSSNRLKETYWEVISLALE
ncbi:MAG: endo-1,4-beta-xylanase [Oscillospiraceae bacterium]|nr:endo-1,4-beta-xylanase [Oscillospiraceae bacterium]